MHEPSHVTGAAPAPGFKPTTANLRPHGSIESVAPLKRPHLKTRLSQSAKSQASRFFEGSSDTAYTLEALPDLTLSSDPATKMVFGGVDLVTLGGLDVEMDFTQDVGLRDHFVSPWADDEAMQQSVFGGSSELVPPAYQRARRPRDSAELPGELLQRCQVEVLFYCFYAMPEDAAQLAAGLVLYDRGWEFHPRLQLWFHCSGPSDKVVYFDEPSWQIRGVAEDMPLLLRDWPVESAALLSFDQFSLLVSDEEGEMVGESYYERLKDTQ